MEPSTLILMLLLQLVLVFFNAVFASAEIAVLSVNETRLSKLCEGGNKRARRLSRITSQPAKFLATIQVAITLSGFLGSAFAADNFSDPLVKWLRSIGLTGLSDDVLNNIVVVVITLILSYVTLIFGELVPKRVAMKKSEAMALGMSGLLVGIARIFAPIVWLLTVSTNGVLRLLGIDPKAENEQVDEEDIRMMVDAGSENGSIDHQEKEFIRNVFEFDDLSAGEIATHRTEVTMLWLDEDMETWKKTIHETRHTRYPVCGESADEVVGILNAKDYFRLDDKNREVVMEKAVRPPYFVPETVKADVLFRNMKKTHNTLAVVLDEYGGVTGIVTMNDLVEQLVGELEDDSDPLPGEENIPVTGIEPVPGTENEYLIHGNVELEKIEETTGVSFANDECDTFTGIAFSDLGYIPDDGAQQLTFETERFRAVITEVQDHQVREARLTVIPAADAEEDGDREKDKDKEKDKDREKDLPKEEA